jgi:hypothetical protein
MKLRMNASFIRAGALAPVGLLVALLVTTQNAPADQGDCAQPVSEGPAPVTTDCLYILKAAVNLEVCNPECVCQPSGGGNGQVTATDALVCLNRVVGNPATLECPCQAPDFVAALAVFTKGSATYATADLEGSWYLHSIAAGPEAPERTRGDLDVQADGSFNGTLVNINGEVDFISGNLNVSVEGIVDCNVCLPPFRGALDAGKTVIVFTDTWDSDTDELLIAVKQAQQTLYSQEDIAGPWRLSQLTSGPSAPLWVRGPVEISQSGVMFGELLDAYGETSPASGVITLFSDGTAECAGCESEFEAAVDADMTVTAYSQTLADGSTDLGVLLSQGPTYSQSDVTGVWNYNVIGAGPLDYGWIRGAVTVAEDGTFSGDAQSSDGFTDPFDGKLEVTAGGIVIDPTESESSLECALDSGKTVMTCTFSD